MRGDRGPLARPTFTDGHLDPPYLGPRDPALPSGLAPFCPLCAAPRKLVGSLVACERWPDCRYPMLCDSSIDAAGGACPQAPAAASGEESEDTKKHRPT